LRLHYLATETGDGNWESGGFAGISGRVLPADLLDIPRERICVQIALQSSSVNSCIPPENFALSFISMDSLSISDRRQDFFWPGLFAHRFAIQIRHPARLDLECATPATGSPDFKDKPDPGLMAGYFRPDRSSAAFLFTYYYPSRMPRRLRP